MDTLGVVGNTIKIFNGRYFDFVNPNPNDLDIETIAIPLSRICRFGGHTPVFYCPTPDQRVLTSSLRWERAGDLRVGDELLGFDEEPIQLGSAGKRKRRFRRCIVTDARLLRRKCIRLIMSDGSSATASEEHPWLLATKKSSNQSWRTCGRILDDIRKGRKRYMHRFFDTWSDRRTYDAGWLSGIFDGEGTLSVERSGTHLGVAQKPGVVLDRVFELLNEMQVHYWSGTPASGVTNVQIKGGWRHQAKVIGALQPLRLISKFRKLLREGNFAKQMHATEILEIVHAEEVGEQDVAGISTSTHTYICEGFGAHNSVAEHCYWAEYLARIDDQPIEIRRAAFMHDAVEALVSDMVKPLKCLIGKPYEDVEARVEAVICERFDVDIPRYYSTWKALDWELLIAERNALWEDDGVHWPGSEFIKKRMVPFEFWGSEDAATYYLDKAKELGIS